MRTNVNIKDPDSGKRRSGVLNPTNGKILTSDGKTHKLKKLEKKSVVNFFETRHNGVIIQKSGRIDA